MDMSMTHLLAGVSFRDPFVLISMGLVLAALSAVLVPLAVHAARTWRLRVPALWAAALAGLLVIPAKVAFFSLLFVLSNFWLEVVERQNMSVGFLSDGYPPWLVPVLAASAWLITYEVTHRRHQRAAGSGAGASVPQAGGSDA